MLTLTIDWLVVEARLGMATEQDRNSRPARSGPLEQPSGSRQAILPPDLAAEPRSIVDREEDLEAISSLLLSDEVRLLTLTGPAGVVQISSANDFSSLALDKTVTASQFAISTLSSSNWYWRVRAKDSAGNPGAWSTLLRFTVN